MYVDDVFDLEELESLRDEAQGRLDANPHNEQAAWDLEDIEGRIEEVSAEVS
ncbi:hypothetical protein ANNAL29_76 [Mycobacterium phage AnnaL29]|uniref:hypothetical protein n=1 Tax=Mycobacterium phage AnnaL29 TaxID=1076630 RepID=UPI00024DEB3D|nr:hypothetical protein O153_gp31 [Mycobacterium phage AnnaL29]YP_009303531.1 hypothetical protein SEA_LOSER_78 [Mycobacterium phage Loser]AGS82757.1 hypothetical protein ANNAL29_76 [Mycobacterium phage AnnaL29]AMS00974.1 hypothetical protein SEA_LOSER_78 [Mycobacterium phage Loser]